MEMKIILFILLLSSGLRAASLQAEDVFEREVREVQEMYGPILSQKDDPRKERLFQEKLKSMKFFCTGGRNPKSMDLKTYLSTFSKGPCNPTAIIPGASMSKLMIQIDCLKFKSSNPQTFKNCGWTSCTGSSSPKPEYRIWIPKINSPFSLFVPSDKRRKCFTGILSFDYRTENGEIKAFDKIGIKSSVIGETESTRRTSSCGFDACSNLLPLKIQTKKMKYLQKWKDLWEAAGYVNGLTFQTLPYDWRISYKNNNLNRKFEQVVNGLFEATGKKVMIVAHSFGNFQALNNLWKMTQEDKDKKIARYISVAPPLLGSARAVQQALGMDSSFFFNFRLFKIGLTPEMSKNTISGYPAAFNLMPREFIKNNEGQEWLKSIYKRIDLESGRKEITKDGSVMDIFPSWKLRCKKGFKKKLRDEGCFTGLYKMSRLGKVVNKEFDASGIEEILSKFSFNEKAVDFWRNNKRDIFNQMPNPGVQMNVLYTNLNPTVVQVEYKNNPKDVVNKGKYYQPDSTVEALGDATIDTTSSITPVIKWADEFRRGVKGAKPMNFVEICSHYQPRKSVFDFNQGEKFGVKKNGYFGVDCSCEGTRLFPSEGKDCDHAGIMVDDKILDFIFKSAVDGQMGTGVGKRFRDMSVKNLREYVDSCELWF